MLLSTGARLGPYEIVDAVGAGGMGEVYRARDTRLDRTVAIKVMREGETATPAARDRFLREARAIAALTHPNICALHDVGHHDGMDFLVMEYLAGETLATRLSRQPLRRAALGLVEAAALEGNVDLGAGPRGLRAALPLDELLHIGIQLADAIAVAHEAGVVHRDSKPGNVMLTPQGVKVLDFGLARLRSLPEAGQDPSERTVTALVTEVGTLRGTLPYMAPEQLEGRVVDGRADIFAIGTIVYEMATGQRAFEADSQASLIAAILTKEPVPITAREPLTPRSLDRVTRRCLAKDPGARWRSAADLADVLRWMAQGERSTTPHDSLWRSLVGTPEAVLPSMRAEPAGVMPLALAGDTASEHLRAPTGAPESPAAPVRRRAPFMAPRLPPGFVPRPREFNHLAELVLGPAPAQRGALRAALQGAGGYGKTWLATALCHDPRVIDAFPDGVLWTSLGPAPPLVDEFARLYAAVTGRRRAFIDVPHAAAGVAEALERRRCLMVLDDVWVSAHLEPFLGTLDRCVRIATTRRLDLLAGAPRIRVDAMSAAESSRVLSSGLALATARDARVEALAKRLGEWPLLLGLAAGMVRKRCVRGDSPEGALAHVVGSLDRRGVTAFDRTDSAQREEAVRRTVAASREQLVHEDDDRFQDLAILLGETAIPLTTLARLWGLDEFDTADCAQRLDDVSLLSLDLAARAVTVHDVMRSYLLGELDHPARAHARLAAAYEGAEGRLDSYGWRWLPYHLQRSGDVAALRSLLLDPSWLQAQLRAVGAFAQLRSLALATLDADLRMLEQALRLSLAALTSDANQLSEQLLGRVPAGASDALDTFREDLRRMAPTPRLHAMWPNLVGPGSLVQTLPHDGLTGCLLLPNESVLSWGYDKTLRVWDLSTGESRVLSGHHGPVTGALRLPDGGVVSWGWDKTLRVWDLATGEHYAIISRGGVVRHALLLPDGRLLSLCEDDRLRVWDLVTGDRRALLGQHKWTTGALVLSEGRALSWDFDATFRVWNLASGEGRALVGHEPPLWNGGALQLADGRVVSWSDDQTLRVWNLATGEVCALAGHERAVTGALELSDGRVVSWSTDWTLRIWDLATGKGRALNGHKGAVTGARRLADGRLLSWSEDRTLRVWDMATGEGRVLNGHEDAVTGARQLPDGRLLSWSKDRTLRAWDLATDERRVLTAHGGEVRGVLRSPDGRLVSWSSDGTLRVWELARAEGRQHIGHRGSVTGALQLDDGRPLSWGDDRTLRIWDVGTGQDRVLTGHASPVTGALRLPHDRLLSWGEESTLRVWDLANGGGRELNGHEGGVIGALVLPDGRVLSWSKDWTLRVWDLITGVGLELTGHRWDVIGALVLPDGRVLSWGRDGTLWVWDLTTGVGRPLIGHEGGVQGAVLLPHDRVLSWSWYTLRVWDLATGEGYTLTGHERGIWGALLLPDDRVLSWGREQMFRVWDLASGEGLAIFSHEGCVLGALLLPGGRLLSWAEDHTLRIWDLATGQGRAIAGHSATVLGAQVLPDNRVLWWSSDRSVRCRNLDGHGDPGQAFFFDAAPTIAVPLGAGELFVGDEAGGIHYLKLVSERVTN